MSEHAITVPGGTSIRLATAGKYCDRDIVVTATGGSTDEGWIGDGNTHIWISLPEGRTSPMLGVCPNGTVTVDWGDRTTPDTLTGTSTSTVQWTPTHNYAKPGDYVITLTVDGQMGFYGGTPANNQYSTILRHSASADSRNSAYQLAVRKVEIGECVTNTGQYAFQGCYTLASVNISDSVTSISNNAFQGCYALASVNIPDSVTSIGNSAFHNCYTLASVTIPDSVASIGQSAFQSCYALASVNIPDSVTSIGSNAFFACYALASVTIPASVTSIERSTFGSSGGVRYYDFTKHTTVPTLSNSSAFSSIPADCEIRVPAALYDRWIVATNWTTYAEYIVAV